MMTSIEKHSDYATSNNQKRNEFQMAICESVKKGQPFYLSQGFTKKDIEELFNKACKLHAQDKYKEAKRLYQLMSAYDHSDKRGWVGAAACLQIQCNPSDALNACLTAKKLTKSDSKEKKAIDKMLVNIAGNILVNTVLNVPQKNSQVMEVDQMMKAGIEDTLALANEYKKHADELRQELQQKENGTSSSTKSDKESES